MQGMDAPQLLDIHSSDFHFQSALLEFGGTQAGRGITWEQRGAEGRKEKGLRSSSSELPRSARKCRQVSGKLLELWLSSPQEPDRWRGRFQHSRAASGRGDRAGWAADSRGHRLLTCSLGKCFRCPSLDQGEHTPSPGQTRPAGVARGSVRGVSGVGAVIPDSTAEPS